MTWYNISWNYRKSITVSNSGSSLTDYQALITIDTASLVTATKMRSDCGDIRITDTDGSTLLSYWIESGINSSSTRIWVKLPSISTGNNTIYLYYGNSSATTTSNGRNTFLVFDDFATGSSEQWTMSNVSSDRTTNHRLNINGVTGSTSAYLDMGSDIGDYEFLYTYTRTSGNAAGFGVGTGDTVNNNIDAPIPNASAVLDHPSSIGGQNKILRVYQAGTNYGTYTVAGAGNTLYYGKLTRLNNVYTCKGYSDEARTSQVWSVSATRAGLVNQRYIYAVITTYDFAYTATGWITGIRIRKLVSSEPTTCVGGEEVPTVSWLSGWDRRKLITITGSTNVQTDYQIKIIAHKSSGTDTSTDIYLGTNVNNDFSDLRFTSNDGSTILNYWIESYTSGSVATVWIKIPSVPIGPCTTTIYSYYGNSGASTLSNGNNTFDFFDDFSGTLSKWTSVGTTITSGRAIIGTTATAWGNYLISTSSFDRTNTGYILSYDLAVNGTSANYSETIHGFSGNTAGHTANPSADFYYGETTSWNTAGYDSGTWRSPGITAVPTVGTYYNYRMRINKTSGGLASWSGSSTTITFTGANNNFYIKFNPYKGGCGVDNVIVRKYISPEPIICIGGEEVLTVLWLSGWGKRKLMTIIGSTSSSQTDYQIKLTVHKSTGADTSTDIYLGTNVKDDFSDIRFTYSDGSTLLNYWIESYTSGSVATVWIKIPSIPASPCTTSIYLYYNNSSATSSSNGTNTFEFFDDFTDLSKWTASSGTWVISSPNVARSTAPGGYPLIYHSFSTYNNITVFGKIQMNDTVNSLYYILVKAATTGTDALNGLGFNFGRSIARIVDNNVVKATVGATFVDATWYNYEFSIASDNSIVARVWKVSDPRPSSPTLTYGAFTPASTGLNIRYDANVSLGHVDYWSNFIIRKYAYTEPIFSIIGTEETSTACGTPSANLVVLEIVSNQLLRQYPSYIDLDAISKLIDNYR